MENKIYYEEDKIGRHKVIEQPNGIKIRLLKEPSEWYRDKQQKKADAERVKREELAEIKAKEKLITERMREIAVRELEAEGKL